MDFKQFFILKERAYYLDVSSFTEEMINKLQEALSKKKSIRSGDTVKVDIDGNNQLDVKFYKRLSKAARETPQSVEGQNYHALYFHKTPDSNGRIEIYVNPSKKGNNYYKERDFEDFINKSLPKYIKDILRHELVHAYEDVVKNTLQYSQDPSDSGEYFNSPHEINAYLIEYLNSLLKSDNMIRYYLSRGDVASTVKNILVKLSLEQWVRNLNKANRQKVIKTVYTFVKDLVDKSR